MPVILHWIITSLPCSHCSLPLQLPTSFSHVPLFCLLWTLVKESPLFFFFLKKLELGQFTDQSAAISSPFLYSTVWGSCTVCLLVPRPDFCIDPPPHSRCWILSLCVCVRASLCVLCFAVHAEVIVMNLFRNSDWKCLHCNVILHYRWGIQH